MKKSEKVITGDDYGSEFFAAIEELGDHMDILLTAVDETPGRQPLRFERFSHNRYDGIGAFTDFLKKREITPGMIPLSKDRSCPSGLKRFSLLAKLMAGEGFKERRDGKGWKDYSYRTGCFPESPDQLKHWFLLSREETAGLHQKASGCGISANSLLLNMLHHSFAPQMISDLNKKCRWMMAVNLRGAVKLNRPEANHSSSLGIYVKNGDAPHVTHQRVKKAFQAGDHWARWEFMGITRLIGKKKLVEGMKRSAAKGKRPYIGTFSNLGSWNLPDYDGAGMLFCPPPGPNTPFAAGALEVNGALGICFQIHPSLEISDEKLAQMMNQFKSKIVTR